MDGSRGTDTFLTALYFSLAFLATLQCRLSQGIYCHLQTLILASGIYFISMPFFFLCKPCPHVVLLHFISDKFYINLEVGYPCSFSQLAGKSRH